MRVLKFATLFLILLQSRNVKTEEHPNDEPNGVNNLDQTMLKTALKEFSHLLDINSPDRRSYTTEWKQIEQMRKTLAQFVAKKDRAITNAEVREFLVQLKKLADIKFEGAATNIRALEPYDREVTLSGHNRGLFERLAEAPFNLPLLGDDERYSFFDVMFALDRQKVADCHEDSPRTQSLGALLRKFDAALFNDAYNRFQDVVALGMLAAYKRDNRTFYGKLASPEDLAREREKIDKLSPETRQYLRTQRHKEALDQQNESAIQHFKEMTFCCVPICTAAVAEDKQHPTRSEELAGLVLGTVFNIPWAPISTLLNTTMTGIGVCRRKVASCLLGRKLRKWRLSAEKELAEEGQRAGAGQNVERGQRKGK